MQSVTSNAVASALRGANIVSSMLSITTDWLLPFTCDIRQLGNLLICNLFFEVTTPQTLYSNTDVGQFAVDPAFTVRTIGVVETTGETIKVEIKEQGLFVLGPYSDSVNINGYVRVESIIIPLAN